MAYYQVGPNSLAVPMTLFKDNRHRVCDAIRSAKRLLSRTFILLQGGSTISFYDTDTNYVFRQESNFQYMFGVKEPDCFGVVEVATCKTTIFVPRLPPDYATWSGPILSLEEFQSIYEVDEVLYVDQIQEYFDHSQPDLILTLNGINSYSGLNSQPAYFEGIEKYIVDTKILYPIITECRVFKSEAEIEVLRYVAKISSDAHIRVMQYMRPGRTEFQGESLFLHDIYTKGGCRHVSYTCICCSGANGAILHYGHAGAPNDRVVKNGDLCLFDMGGSYCGYSADITCTFPANGKFTKDQKFIYNAVLAAQRAVFDQIREGVSWADMQILGNQILLEQLRDGGMLKGNTDEMLAAGLAGIFQPHGLGHLLGLDVHDVGAFTQENSKIPSEPFLKALRLSRVLKAGMYITVEPGCYFIDRLMDDAICDKNLRKFINIGVFERFRNFGGVRIEDDVLITKNGYENFTKVPRTVDEIERVMCGNLKSSGSSIFCWRRF